MKNGVAGGLAVGLAQGIERGFRLRRDMDKDEIERKRQEEADRRAQETHQRAGESHEITLRRAKRDDAADDLKLSDQQQLRAASAPATVAEAPTLPAGLSFGSNEDADAAAAGTPNAPMPEAPRFRVEGGGGVQRFDTPEQAQAAAGAQNDPITIAKRQATVLAGQGKTAEAMKLTEEVEKQTTAVWRKKLGEALMQGHTGLADMATGSEAGPFKGKKVQAVPSEDGKSVTYHVDGKPTQLTFPNSKEGAIEASYMLDSAIKPEDRYKFTVEADRKRVDAERKERELTDVKIPLAEARMQALKTGAETAQTRAEVSLLRAEIASKKGDTNGNGKVDSEDRKRWTSLHSESGRRLSDTSKELRQLQQDMIFMARAKKPGTPEAAQLASLQGDVEEYKKDRELYGGLLAGEKGAAAKAEAAAAPGAAPAPGARIPAATQAARDSDRTAILQSEVAKAEARVKAGDPRAQGDLDSLRRELGGATKGAKAPASAAKTPANAPAIALPKAKSDLIAGKIYSTARGNAKWDGSKFVVVK